MKALSAFRSRVSPRVQGCNDMLIDQAVLDSCIEFCDKSLAVKRMLDAFPLVAEQSQYDLSPPAGQVVVQVMRVWCDTSELQPVDEDTLASPFQFVQAIPGHTRRPAMPGFFSESDPSQLSFYPVPDKAYTVNLRVALRPSRAATQVEDQLFETHIETIVDGALARLYVMPSEFANPAAAKLHLDKFHAGIDEALLQSSRGNTRAQQRITPVHI